jgi:hypothetical protein
LASARGRETLRSCNGKQQRLIFLLKDASPLFFGSCSASLQVPAISSSSSCWV